MLPEDRVENLHLPVIGALPVLRGDMPCPYLPNEMASWQLAFWSEIDSAAYQILMDSGFRRSGALYYRPDCPNCRACVPIRVRVADFVESRSQRRVRRRNADVQCSIGPPQISQEAYSLYRRYQEAVHNERPASDPEEWARSLMASSIDTFVMSYRLHGRLIGQGVVDQTPDALSSVYFVYDPDEHRRSLGVFSCLREIDECRQRGLPFWYLGLHVSGCAKMAYKTQFRPYELLGADGRWRPGASCLSEPNRAAQAGAAQHATD